MAPKPTSLPAATQKQTQILAYLHDSHTAHTLKELEKHLPGAVAGLHAMHVKDHLQALVDDGHVRVEKIGTGNWYWAFASEAAHRRRTVLETLRVEKAAVEAGLEELRDKIADATASVCGGEGEGEGQGDDRADLLARTAGLDADLTGLRAELEGYQDRDPDALERVRVEMGRFKAETERWTDNIGVLEGRVKELMGGDRERLEMWQREVYGGEFVEGVGLAEL